MDGLGERPRTEAEMVRWLVEGGMDKLEAEFVAGIEFGSTKGDLVEVISNAILEKG